ncbi:GNAT family N-acetyltransferase [Thalassococcus sp. S3]|uniref:GNAT family N-acetyltransferase n=1 Tax=Thalassococcus sp. S3 TaxID=2017482 RepID=UPI0010246091|nr:GNAT family protein [Thalassococcus sp. S3]QBF30948.1 GNAT family N-acetyltransferase [Thalassococcus sp. S3]
MTITDLPPLGAPVPDWTPPPAPDGAVLEGRYCRLEPLSAEAHSALLHGSFDGHDDLWHYMPCGPFTSAAQYHRWVRETVADPGHLFFAIRNLETDILGGVASFLRIDPMAGSIEVGNICFAPVLQRSRAATEAMALMMKWAFEAGYRRYEWKCNALNHPSRAAAQRLGFSYEGVFRQATVVKGRNRDTSWFAVIDSEWPALREAYRVWLDPKNFDERGQQIERLSDLTRLVRVSHDPTL